MEIESKIERHEPPWQAVAENFAAAGAALPARWAGFLGAPTVLALAV